MIYDLFISYKSNDFKIANEIYVKLLERDENLKIFFSESTLDKIGNSDYMFVIETAIKNSKNMVIVGTNIDNFISKWVSYEWHLFKHYKLNDNEEFYNNLFLAIDKENVDIKMLPGALQICECIDYRNIEQLYAYSFNNEKCKIIERQKGYSIIQEIFENIGWKNSVFVTPERFGQYEKSLDAELSNVTIVSHSLIHDAPGGALFQSVKNNLFKGVKYNYIFLNGSSSFGILRRIYNGHSDKCRQNLLLEISSDSFWALGNYACITIYEFNNSRPSEGFLRVLVESKDRGEFPIYLRMSNHFIDNIWNCIVKYRKDGSITKFDY